MRTERQRRERQMRDIVKAYDAKTGDIARACERARKVAEVTARLRPPAPKVESRPTVDYVNHAHKLWSAKLRAELDQMIYRSISSQVDHRVDALSYAFTHR